ncbi:MAG: SRPBCC family protein [Saprospiraceae bacterium]
MAKIQHQFIVSAVAEKVFEAFCTPQGLDSWWPLHSAGKPEKGNIYTFYFGPQYDWRASVISVKPNRALTWQMTQAMEDWIPTRVGFRLQEKNGQTTVYFFHEGWQSANEHFRISNYCWGQLLAGLKNYVETGAIVPFEQRN